MITIVKGNIIQITIQSSDIGVSTNYTLPDGYSVRKFFYSGSNNVSVTANGLYIPPNNIIVFPVVNSKSPNFFKIYANSNSKDGDVIRIIIFELGCIPDSNYFNNDFTPILVKSKNENGDVIEYNMIPSTQFER